MRFLLPLVMLCMYSSTALAAVDSGLVAWWSFCSCDATDNSGNGYDGTIISNPQCVNGGVAGQALRFNIVDEINDCNRPGGDYITVPALPPVWEGGFSVTAWAQFEEGRNYERIIDFGNGSGDEGGTPIWFGRVQTGNSLALESWIDNNTGSNRSTGRLTAFGGIIHGSMHFYCATIDPQGRMAIYIDGVLAAEKDGHRILNTERRSNFIARSNWCAADPDFRGVLDEVRIYNRPLTPGEINELYSYRTASVPPFPDTTIICGESISLRTQPGINHHWAPSNGLSCDDCPLPSASPDRTTTYIVEFTGADGCPRKDTITVSVELLQVELSSTKTGCPGDTIVLDAGAGYTSYQWSNGSTGQSVRITVATTLTVTTVNEFGCTQTSQTFDVRFGINLSDYFPSDMLIIDHIQVGSILCKDIIITNPDDTARHIAWARAEFNSDISIPLHQFPIHIPPGESATLTVCFSPSHSGTIADILSIDGFCDPLRIVAGGIAFSDTTELPCGPPILLQERTPVYRVLYKPRPNPATDYVTLLLDTPHNSALPATCTLVSQPGLPVAHGVFTPSDAGRQSECTLDVRNLAAGVYRAVVNAGGSPATVNVVIAR